MEDCLSNTLQAHDHDEIFPTAIGVRREVENHTGQKYKKYIAVEYRSQKIGEEILYYIKVNIGDENCIIIKVLWTAENRFELQGVKENVDSSDPIEKFKNDVFPPEEPHLFRCAPKVIQYWTDALKEEAEKRTDQVFDKFVAKSFHNKVIEDCSEGCSKHLFYIWVEVGCRKFVYIVLKSSQSKREVEMVKVVEPKQCDFIEDTSS
ncbi:unnamed protein product [Clavelina lepadiformis]|uniref:Cystatin domain-containing protein n=1 Tax=Clavelina lepadiformis TaxID=159417 RepID=A0ABP0GV98_CLALP